MKIIYAIAAATIALSSLFGGQARAAEELPKVVMYKSPYCGCCTEWGKHMEAAGFTVEVKKVENIDQVKVMFGVPDDLASCHTARVGDYVVEGHVPAQEVMRLLTEAPKDVAGISVPGMPQSAPGMDVPDATDSFPVVAYDGQGRHRVVNTYGTR